MVYLGTIAASDGVSVNNLTTAVPFNILSRYKYVGIWTPSASGIYFGVSVGINPALAATTNDYQLTDDTFAQFAVEQDASGNPVVAIYGVGGGGDVKVYGLYGLAQS